MQLAISEVTGLKSLKITVTAIIGIEMIQISETKERPKLVLAPLTKPIENVTTTESVPSAATFENTKPTQRKK